MKGKIYKTLLSSFLALCLVCGSFTCLSGISVMATSEDLQTVFTDDFNRADGSVGNDWVIGSRANASISNNLVLLSTTNKQTWATGEQDKPHVEVSALVRPQTEATLNQIVSADFKANYDVNKVNIGGAVIARCQGETASDSNCYSAYVRMGYDGADNTDYDLVLKNTSGIIYRAYTSDLETVRANGLQSRTKHRLTLKAESVSGAQTELTVSLYAIDNNGTATLIMERTVVDNDANLQTAGTAGFSLYDRWGMTMTVDDFSYQTFVVEETPDTPVESDSNEIAFKDDFNREDGYVSNDWIPWSSTTGSETNLIVNNQLKVIDTSNNNGVCTRILERPMSTAGTVNQYVSVEIHNLLSLSNYSTANIHLRNIHTKYNNEVHTGTSGPDQSYYVEATYDHIRIKRVKSDWTTANVSDQATYNHITGHVYRVEFTAQGQYPTKLTATLYDVTADDTAVATVSAEDSTALLQRYGTVALSCTRNSAGQDYALFDNFVYRQADAAICNDSLTRTDSTVGNNWSLGNTTNATFNEDGELQLTTTHPANDHAQKIYDSALMRPASEASLNQVLSVDFKPLASRAGVSGQGPTLIARCQGDRPNSTNHYSARLFASDSSNLRLWIYRGDTLISDNTAITTSGGMPIDKTFRLQFSVTSISATTTKLVATVYNINDENVPLLVKTMEATDSTSELQNAGTAGFSVYDQYGVKGWFNNFQYSSTEFASAPITYRFLETEYNAYANHYYKAKDANAYDSIAFKQTNDIVKTVSYEDIASNLNQESAYIAYPIYAAAAGGYSLKLRFKMGATNASALENANPYAAMVVNGTKTKFMFTAESGEYCISTPVTVSLDAGVNMLYFMAPTSEILNAASGAYIDYDSVIAERSLSAAAGTFTFPGDVNSDKTANILDLVSFKKYLSGVETKIDHFAANLWAEDGKAVLNAQDLSALITALLGASEYDISWIRFINSNEMNPISALSAECGGADAQANAKKRTILSATDLMPTAKTYYVSSSGSASASGTSPSAPWNMAGLKNNYSSIKSGATVLFERGSVFRQSEEDDETFLSLISGVSYGAYGNGNKPRFYGSSMNYAYADWEEEQPGIWKTSLDIDEDIDAGIIVFDYGSSIGVKQDSLENLANGNDFYHDTESGILYIYSEMGSPAEIYKDIEIGLDRYVFYINDDKSNIRIDNLDIRYVGAHAIRGNYGNQNITITNCEISFVGGSVQNSSATGVRYGNAIEFYDEVADIMVDNCWIHQVYDAGLTFQCTDNGTEYSNINFTNNLLQYCNYSIEFFIGQTANAPGALDGINFTGNIMQFAGFGVCEQRPSKVDSAHICGWVTNVGYEDTDMTISGNIFDIANYNIVNWHWDGEANSNIKVSGNTYYMKPSASSVAMRFSNVAQNYATDQETLLQAVNVFDSNPSTVAWLAN